MNNITIFTAKKIHTMSMSAPEAEAVAVRDGMILEAGTLESLKPWMDSGSVTIDDRFADKILFPGFIDPHLHPALGAVLLPSFFLTAMEWNLPGRTVPATKGRDNYLAALKEAFDAQGRDREVFVTWGYHQLWHGEVTREDLNVIAPDHPLVIWHRSFHELILNDAAVAFIDADPEMMERHPQINTETGRFSETGAQVAVQGLRPFLFAPQRFMEGLLDLLKVVHRGGHTTVADMAFGIFDFEQEWMAFNAIVNRPEVPLRVLMVPKGLPNAQADQGAEASIKVIEELETRGNDRLFFDRRVKLFTDGAIFSELMQMQEPGFIDGHNGEWLMVPELFEERVRAFWQAGFKIHVHCTGNLGHELALDVLEKMQKEHPRLDPCFTIEHFGVSTEEQVWRIKELGARVSANPYYVHELGETYWAKSIGYERASQMVRLGSLVRADVPFALHSDFTMAPAEPLKNAWVAVNRLSESGKVLAPNERISVHQAMRAITIDAARIMGMEGKIGSIRSGKKADFTVLDQDPYEIAPEDLKDIPVVATVFEGTVFEVEG
jgi:predicted amidohydrolase YtcJ